MPVSVVMPCFNEVSVIEKVVRAYYAAIVAEMDDAEFIVVDDCSTDGTAAVLASLARELPRLSVVRTASNGGHGRAVRTGYDIASKEYVFQVDSDGQFEAGDFRKLYGLRDRYDLVLGVRASRHDAAHRLVLTRIIRGAIFLLFGVRLADPNCPFRLMKNDALRGLLRDIDEAALAPNIMISVLGRVRGLAIAEVPVTHRAREAGSSSLVNVRLVRFALKGLGELIAFKRRIRNGQGR